MEPKYDVKEVDITKENLSFDLSHLVNVIQLGFLHYLDKVIEDNPEEKILEVDIDCYVEMEKQIVMDIVSQLEEEVVKKIASKKE